MPIDGKTYTLGGDHQLTEKQRKSVKEFQDGQDQKQQELANKQMEMRKTVARATLESVLQTTIEPMEDRVLVWPDPVAEVTDTGIIKPQEVVEKERPYTGTVIAVGPGKKIEQQVTNVLLLNLLQYGSDISKDNLNKLKEEVSEISIPLSPGMRVFYGRLAGTPIPDPGTKEELLIMRPSDIFSKIKE